VLVAEERKTRFTEADFVVFIPHRLWYNLSSTDSSLRIMFKNIAFLKITLNALLYTIV